MSVWGEVEVENQDGEFGRLNDRIVEALLYI